MNLKYLGGLLALCLAASAVPRVLADPPSPDKAEKAADKVVKAVEKAKSHQSLTLASFKLDDSLPEGPTLPGAFGDMSPNLGKLMDRIDQAAKDDKIFGIMLHINDPQLGRGKVNELRVSYRSGPQSRQEGLRRHP